MRRILAGLYGLAGYLAFLLPIGYLVVFLADAVVPKTVDRGAGPVGPSLVVDLLLVAAFALQHSVMARPGFKRVVQRWVPEGLERSTYVLASGLVLGALFWLWRPIPAVLWDVSGTPLGAMAWAGFGAGWALAVWATFALSHLHLFGVTQAAAYARGDDHPRPDLRDSRLYRIVRHPMTAGLLLVFWSAPRMTLGHAVFAAGMTLYSLGATVLEERDLIREFPESYRRYRGRVPALLPMLRTPLFLRRRWSFVLELVLIGALATAPLAGALDVSPGPGGPGPTDPPMESGSIHVDGRARTFDLFDPVSGEVSAMEPWTDRRPLVLALHGTGGDGSRLRRFLGGALERAAAERGWIVAYPAAVQGVWRDCRLRGGASPRQTVVDDLSYLRALVAHLTRTRPVDPSRVFVVGYSGGGHMAFRVILEAPTLVSGAAVFGASPPTPEASVCRQAEGGVPVLLVNGTADLVSPFGGGEVITPRGVPLGPVLPSEEGARYLEERGGGRTTVRLLRVEGGGHVVPGPASRFPAVAGRTLPIPSGVESALAFFESHGRISGTGGPSGANDRRRS